MGAVARICCDPCVRPPAYLIVSDVVLESDNKVRNAKDFYNSPGPTNNMPASLRRMGPGGGLVPSELHGTYMKGKLPSIIRRGTSVVASRDRKWAHFCSERALPPGTS